MGCVVHQRRSLQRADQPILERRRQQESCHFSAETQAAILPLLRRKLDRRGLQDTPLAASDENQCDLAAAVWQVYDASTRALVSQVNVHGYQKTGGRRDVLSGLTKGRRRWNAEYGENDATGLQMAHNFHLDFRYLRPFAGAIGRRSTAGVGD